MSERLDVRRMLLRRGWTEDRKLWPVLRKNGAHWAPTNNCGDSGFGAAENEYTINFDSGVPARVIVAACEEAAKATRSRRAASEEKPENPR